MTFQNELLQRDIIYNDETIILLMALMVIHLYNRNFFNIIKLTIYTQLLIKKMKYIIQVF